MAGSSIAHRLTRRVEIAIDGQAWPILFTHDVLLDIEAVCGMSILSGELNLGKPSAKALRAVLHVALKHAGAKVSLEAAGRLLGSIRLIEVRNAIIAAWIAAMPEADPEESRGGGQVKNWMEAWAIARHDLGLSAQEWLTMTPRMLQALSRQRLEDMRQREFMQSRMTAMAANFGARGPKEPFADDLFMLHPWPRKDESRPEHIDGLYIMKAFRQRA